MRLKTENGENKASKISKIQYIRYGTEIVEGFSHI